MRSRISGAGRLSAVRRRLGSPWSLAVLAAAGAAGLGFVAGTAAATPDERAVKVTDTFSAVVVMVSQDGSKVCVRQQGRATRCGQPFQMHSTAALTVGAPVEVAVESVETGPSSSVEVFLILPAS